ncbi:hypothetical protein CspeluHIS016_0402890 [Cutaneotrichosporon spelunceum]|uniref:F-box domain-containing protein n=1 Tax=Cutaneotrichosporon spelunceum TaxID=1672016 RepID=A0AAD3YBW1_9TREE|nr:hypothetical protein CspeluHIS016_0402890 [Cutaneotrichosporon spelunceum]
MLDEDAAALDELMTLYQDTMLLEDAMRHQDEMRAGEAMRAQDAMHNQGARSVSDTADDNKTKIDADFFDHLVKLIVAFAPYESLLRLRTVSRKLRAMVDQRLVAGRIIVTALGPEPTPSDSGDVCANSDASDEEPNASREYSDTSGGHSRSSHLHYNTRRYDHSKPLPDPPDLYTRLGAPVIVESLGGRIPAFAGMARRELFDPSAHDLSLTRVVDLIGVRTLTPQPVRITCTRQKPLLPGASDILSAPSLDWDQLTVRFMHNRTGDRDDIETPPEDSIRAVAGSADTTVLFSPLPHIFYHNWQAPSMLLWPTPQVYPPRNLDLRRAVINLSVHPDDALPDEFSASPLSCPEVVYVFHCASTPVEKIESRADALRTTDNTRESMLHMLIYVIALPLSHGDEATAAGIEAFVGWPGWEAEPGETEWEGVVRVFRQKCRNTLGGVGMGDCDPEQALRRLTLMTLAELRDELGPERAAIETMESGWP